MSRTRPSPRKWRQVVDPLSTPPSSPPETVTPSELCEWLARHQDEVASRWLVEVRARTDGFDREMAEILGDFFRILVSFLPRGVGPWRDQVEPLFQQAAELYGSFGSVRGLAAGEAVEEFQILREVLLRFLFQDPPAGEGLRLGLREALRLNRMVDLGVTHASVGHTDALFFNLLHGSGVTVRPEAPVLEEFRAQMLGLAAELERIRPGEPASEASPTH
jgi:hypothetical protein